MSTYDVILHPTDFSEESYRAFQLACSLARDQFASLVIVHVLPAECGSGGGVGEDAGLEDSEVVRNCREHFGRMKAMVGDIPISFRIVCGYPVGSILNVAHDEHADLIVVASHQHPQFYLQLHGSVAEGLLRQTHCPVMVLRQPSHQTPMGARSALMRQPSDC